jgi:hypothetical protein
MVNFHNPHLHAVTTPAVFVGEAQHNGREGMVVRRTFSDGRTDGRSDDARGGVRDLDAL